MRTIIIALLTALLSAAAQDLVNLAGPYHCIDKCATTLPRQFAYATQNGWDLTVVGEVGAALRAWIDDPGRLWINAAQMGATYSPDGMTIEFDDETIWQRALAVPPPPLGPHR